MTLEIPMRVWMAVTMLALVACGSKEDDSGTKPGALPTCAGGGDASLELGRGGTGDFTPFADGEEITLTQQNDAWGLRLELLTAGIDTTDSASLFINLAFDPPEEETYGASLTLVCDDNIGTGWFAFFAGLPAPYDADPAQLQGRSVPFEAILTDAQSTSVSDTGEVKIRVVQ